MGLFDWNACWPPGAPTRMAAFPEVPHGELWWTPAQGGTPLLLGEAFGLRELPAEGTVELRAGAILRARPELLAAIPPGAFSAFAAVGAPSAFFTEDAFHALANIESLDVSHSAFGNAEARLLPRLSSLRAIDVSHTRIADAGFLELARMRCLESIAARYTHLSTAALAALIPQRTLRRLHLGATRLSPDALEFLLRCGNLESLEVPGGIEEPEIPRLATLVRLRELRLGECLARTSSLRAIARLEHLEQLQLGLCEIDDDLAGVQFPRLCSLRLADARLLAEYFPPERVPSLAHLRLDYRHTRAELEAMPAHAGLKSLMLAYPLGDPALLPAWEGMRHFAELNAPMPQLDDGNRWNVHYLRGLRRLHLARSGLTARGLLMLRREMYRAEISHAVHRLPPIAGCRATLLARPADDASTPPWRIHLDLARGGLVPADRELSIRAAKGLGLCLQPLPPHVAANVLDLACIGGEVSESTAGAIASFPSLWGVRFDHCRLPVAVAEALGGHSALRQANLDFTPLEAGHVAALAKAPSLAVLSLRGCGLGDAEAAHLAAAAALRDLDLRDNAISLAAQARLRAELPNAAILFGESS